MVACTNQLAQVSWGNMKGVRCAGHTLQLCINSALKQDPALLLLQGALFLTSKKAQRPPQHLKRNRKNSPEHKLAQEVLTQWNSAYLMLNRLIEQKGPVSAMLTDPSVSKRSDRDLELSTLQWHTAKDIQ